MNVRSPEFMLHHVRWFCGLTASSCPPVLTAATTRLKSAEHGGSSQQSPIPVKICRGETHILARRCVLEPVVTPPYAGLHLFTVVIPWSGHQTVSTSPLGLRLLLNVMLFLTGWIVSADSDMVARVASRRWRHMCISSCEAQTCVFWLLGDRNLLSHEWAPERMMERQLQSPLTQSLLAFTAPRLQAHCMRCIHLFSDETRPRALIPDGPSVLWAPTVYKCSRKGKGRRRGGDSVALPMMWHVQSSSSQDGGFKTYYE